MTKKGAIKSTEKKKAIDKDQQEKSSLTVKAMKWISWLPGQTTSEIGEVGKMYDQFQKSKKKKQNNKAEAKE